jgi:hypothetical protein
MSVDCILLWFMVSTVYNGKEEFYDCLFTIDILVSYLQISVSTYRSIMCRIAKSCGRKNQNLIALKVQYQINRLSIDRRMVSSGLLRRIFFPSQRTSVASCSLCCS